MTADVGELIESWKDQDFVILIDAVASSHRPGTILRFDAIEAPLDAGLFGTSSHSLGVHAAVELARALDQLPERLIIFGIVGQDFGQGTGLSEAVQNGVCEAVTAVEAIFGGLTNAEHS
jgi:hydrogenase maturation protease